MSTRYIRVLPVTDNHWHRICWIYWICSVILALELVGGTVENAEDFEIKTLSGEPNYKSVNLTWEMGAVTSKDSGEYSAFPKVFTIFYCELQSFGPQRCRSKVLEDNTIDAQEYTTKHYSTNIDNLRMATKYSFHIKPQTKRGISGRSDSRTNDVDPESKFSGQTIVIPTKGFSAQATKCLPHASEIEIETGPYFGGKIVVDGGNCGIQGNPKDARNKYVMRIDHTKCGSVVKPESNTVETFITVQENLGIFTHSTRRFVVVCTFQSGIQTVRASFTVPGKGGITSVDTDYHDTERNGRERHFKMVDKSALILKEPTSAEQKQFESDSKDSLNSVAEIENIVPASQTSEKIKSNSSAEKFIKEASRSHRHANFDRLIDEVELKKNEMPANSSASYMGLLIAVSLAVIMIGVLVFLLQREFRRSRSQRAPHISPNYN